jgi:hypothetical protein
MGGEVRLPPRLGCSPQLSGTVQHLLTIVALGSVQLPLHGTQPIFGVHGISRVSKGWGMAWTAWVCIKNICSMVIGGGGGKCCCGAASSWGACCSG